MSSLLESKAEPRPAVDEHRWLYQPWIYIKYQLPPENSAHWAYLCLYENCISRIQASLCKYIADVPAKLFLLHEVRAFYGHHSRNGSTTSRLSLFSLLICGSILSELLKKKRCFRFNRRLAITTLETLQIAEFIPICKKSNDKNQGYFWSRATGVHRAFCKNPVDLGVCHQLNNALWKIWDLGIRDTPTTPLKSSLADSSYISHQHTVEQAWQTRLDSARPSNCGVLHSVKNN